MRFVAALDTVIFGVFYAQGAEVNTVGWTRKMLLQFLELGIIQAAYLTTGSISDRLEFNGNGVTTEIVGNKIVVTIDPDIDLPPISFADLVDVDMTGLADGNVPVWDEDDSTWRAGTSGASASGASVSRRLSNMSSASGVRDVIFDTEDTVDTGFTAVLAAGTIQVPATGWYHFAGHVTLSSAASGYKQLFVTADGVTVLRGDRLAVSSLEHDIAGVARVTAGQLVKLRWESATSTVVAGNSDPTATTFRVTRV